MLKYQWNSVSTQITLSASSLISRIFVDQFSCVASRSYPSGSAWSSQTSTEKKKRVDLQKALDHWNQRHVSRLFLGLLVVFLVKPLTIVSKASTGSHDFDYQWSVFWILLFTLSIASRALSKRCAVGLWIRQRGLSQGRSKAFGRQ